MNLGKISPGRSPYKIIFIFALISFFVIVFVFYTSFSKANIVLKLRREKINTFFEVALGEEKANATLISGRIIEKEINGSTELNEIKNKKVDDFASGKVIVYNKQAKNLTLVSGSQLAPSNSDIIFKTDAPLILKPNSKQEVNVTATQKGLAGELEPTKFTFIKLWLGWKNLVYAENKEKFKNGQKEGKFVSEDDINSLRTKLTDDLFAKALEELKTDLKDNEEIWDQVFKKEITNFKTSADINSEADKLKADMKLKITGALINKEMLKNLAVARLKGQIIGDMEFAEFNDDEFKAEIIEIDQKKNTALFRISCSSFLKPILPKNVLEKEKIIGLNKDEVKTYYKKYQEEIEDIDVSFSPFWQKSVPSGNVEIIVK